MGIGLDINFPLRELLRQVDDIKRQLVPRAAKIALARVGVTVHKQASISIREKLAIKAALRVTMRRELVAVPMKVRLVSPHGYLPRYYQPVRVQSMGTKRVSITEASGHLAELIEAARQGDDVLIEDEGKTQARLVAVPARRARRILGLHKGEIQIREDFNAPLPDDFWQGGTP